MNDYPEKITNLNNPLNPVKVFFEEQNDTIQKRG